MKENRSAILAISAILIFIPPLIDSQFIIQSIIMVILYAYLATSWNIIGGFGGQLSFGHATFVGIGAYVSTVLFITWNISPWIGMIIGGFLGGVMGLIIGYPCFKLKGSYFTLCSIAFLYVVQIFVVSKDKIFGFETRGAEGLSVPWQGESFVNMQFLNKIYYYYIILILLAIVMLVSYWIKHSKLGYYLAAINTNQEAADSLGVNVSSYKLKAQFLSCFFTAVGGSLYAQLITFIDPTNLLGFDLSMTIALLAIIGGRGTVVGPFIGAILLVPIDQIARMYLGSSKAGLAVVLYGIILMLTVYYLPEGLEKYIVKLIYKSKNKIKISRSKSVGGNKA